MTDSKLLRIYLNDHRAGAVAGRELAERCLANNRDSELGDYLREFLRELDEDAAVVDRLIDATGGRRAREKQALAWLTEKVGRLKLNGQLTGYSDLSRLLELEGLCLGVEGKLSLWRSLQRVANELPDDLDWDRLEDRAQRQRDTLERYRLDAADRALRADTQRTQDLTTTEV